MPVILLVGLLTGLLWYGHYIRILQVTSTYVRKVQTII